MQTPNGSTSCSPFYIWTSNRPVLLPSPPSPPLPGGQLWGAESGALVSPSDGPVAGVTADAAGPAGAWLSPGVPRQLLAEPAGALRLGPGPPEDHPEA